MNSTNNPKKAKPVCSYWIIYYELARLEIYIDCIDCTDCKTVQTVLPVQTVQNVRTEQAEETVETEETEETVLTEDLKKKQSLTHLLTDNLKARDASASKN